MLAAGTSLQVVGRAGVGLDNVDVTAATDRGVMVVNAPTSNILSVAEQAMALLLAQARNIPQAHASLVAGRWERSKWEGVELHGKVLGVVGPGPGRLAGGPARPRLRHGADRLRPLRLAGAGPGHGRAPGHASRSWWARPTSSPSTPRRHPRPSACSARDLLAKAKPGIRIINTARGGIVDEEALAEAIRDGIVAGAGLDVFAKEPCTDSPLFALPGVVVSPHLGASTEEAQDKAGVTIAEQVLLSLAGDFVPYAVNVAATDVSDVVRPFMPLAEQLGRFFACLHDGLPDGLEIECQGELAAVSTGILTLSALKGVFAGSTEEPVSYVNAPQLAEQRGLEVRETSTGHLARLQVAHHAALGVALGGGHPDHGRPAAPSRASSWSTTTWSRWRRRRTCWSCATTTGPGMIGIVGTALGAAGISISSMAVGPSPAAATAMMVISTTAPAPDAVVDQLRGDEGILDIHRVSLWTGTAQGRGAGHLGQVSRLPMTGSAPWSGASRRPIRAGRPARRRATRGRPGRPGRAKESRRRMRPR